MKDNSEKFNEAIKDTLASLVDRLEEDFSQEIRASIKDFWPEYSGNVLFIAGPQEAGEEYFTIEVSTETNIKDSARFYSGNGLLNFLKDTSTSEAIMEKVKNMGMFLLMEEDRFNDDWE